MNEYPFVDFGFSFLSNGILYSNNTDFILNPVKGLLDDHRKITDRVGTQSERAMITPHLEILDFRRFMSEEAVKSLRSNSKQVTALLASG
ncbi:MULTISPECIES: hypothetical protein [unclassified Coleofasciculus]|uniref:hypothetical protein n=1 Tax=unclassified Coleofasciculus TaxID=2692782 RepID=UPI001882ED69|nr:MULTISPECIES: hypothetical protein [unclassified Coleofasciculus]MBE9130084.1 hypothetical protein [Coleofasciculus sp. LEGE 07081]MBE9152434.1 hypothetical protein [Coleofasciculus sp. LEGE 07092]